MHDKEFHVAILGMALFVALFALGASACEYYNSAWPAMVVSGLTAAGLGWIIYKRLNDGRK